MDDNIHAFVRAEFMGWEVWNRINCLKQYQLSRRERFSFKRWVYVFDYGTYKLTLVKRTLPLIREGL